MNNKPSHSFYKFDLKFLQASVLNLLYYVTALTKIYDEEQ